MKICLNCKIEKPLEEFYAHSAMKDGHLNKCIECVKSRVKKHRANNIDYIRAYDRKRGLTEKRKKKVRQYHRENKDKVNAYKAVWAAKNWSAVLEAKKKWLENNKHKREAHMLVQYAVRRKDLIPQPCEVCGNKKVDAHHDDYTKPLKVRWLCRTHHAEIHRKYKD